MSILIIVSCYSGVVISTNSLNLNYILYLIILVSIMDIFAYIGGNLFGNSKIIPTISNGKTVEGTLIGLIFTTIFAFLFKELPLFNNINSCLFGLSIGVCAFLGDLIESKYKRLMCIKDSGSIVPGHGGLLDRFDGYLVALPFATVILIITSI